MLQFNPNVKGVIIYFNRCNNELERCWWLRVFTITIMFLNCVNELLSHKL